MKNQNDTWLLASMHEISLLVFNLMAHSFVRVGHAGRTLSPHNHVLFYVISLISLLHLSYARSIFQAVFLTTAREIGYVFERKKSYY